MQNVAKTKRKQTQLKFVGVGNGSTNQIISMSISFFMTDKKWWNHRAKRYKTKWNYALLLS